MKQHGIKRLSINSTQTKVRQIYAENKQKKNKMKITQKAKFADKNHGQKNNLISRENSMN